MILTSLMLTPLVGALVLGVVPRSNERLAKIVAATFSLATLAGSLAMLTRYDISEGGFQLAEKHLWVKSFGVYYALGVDGIGLTLILLTTVLTPIVLLAAWDDRLPDGQRFHGYLAWMLGLEGLAIGVFSAMDAALFYALFEATLIPIFFLIGTYGTGPRTYAAVKFLIYNLVGGLLMLASIIGLYFLSSRDGSASFLISDLIGLEIGADAEKLLFLGFMAAFAIKAPLFPFHTWLPDAAASATPSTAVLMVSVIDKVGTFGMLRWGLGLFPGAAEWATPVVVTLAVISVVYGALLAIGQDDLRRLDRVHVGVALRVHHSRPVRHDVDVDRRCDVLHVQPRPVDGGAVPDRRHPDRPSRVREHRRLRRRAEGGTGPDRPVPDRRPVEPVAAGLGAVHLGVHGHGRHVHAVSGRGHRVGRRDRARRDLHPRDVPADDDRPVA